MTYFDRHFYAICVYVSKKSGSDREVSLVMNENKIKIYVVIVAFFLVFIFPVKLLAGDVYQIDPVHSSVQFRIKHLAISNVYGNFTNFSGKLIIDPENPTKNSIEAFVTAQSVNTNTPKRDNHLRSPDFFDAENFPKVSFKSNSWKKLDNEIFEVSGDLTLLGVTRPLKVELLQTGAGKDPWGGYRVGFETSFTIERNDFKMGEMQNSVGGKVNIIVSIEAVRK